jgi:maltooligosyltrehalose trehalohydrolase
VPNQPNVRPFVSTQRVNEMKFGTQITASGTRFRLWAPRSESVELLLGDTKTSLPMSRQPRGWFECHATEASPGALYRFRLADGTEVPDPASRFQPQGVMGPSEVIDPRLFAWTDVGWVGRPWEQAVIYELHIGAFTPEGSFRAAAERLDYLVALGVTAIELMPVNAFPGRWNWGYDGVLPFAPDASYGRPEELKALIDAAHARGLMVLLDVVYNHFGPKGNFLPQYAPVLTEAHTTPWGAAMNFDGPGSEMVRDFILANARYWLTEYHFDGLRLDAVHEIKDDGFNHLLHDLALQIRSSTDGRHTHLIVENEDNNPDWLGRTADLRAGLYDAQWNDDVHHLIDVKLYGDQSNYRADYLERGDWLPRALATGFGFQGEGVPTKNGAPKGGPSADLPPVAFISFIQNHDQIGNRLFGERIGELANPAKARVAAAIYLLSAQVPLLFMGEEWGSRTPFLFFSDVDPAFAEDIRKSRKENFGPFVLPEKADLPIPDPMAAASFTGSKLDWGELERDEHVRWLELYRELIALRRREIVPLLTGVGPRSGTFDLLNGGAFRVRWQLADGNVLTLLANLGDIPVRDIPLPAGRRLWDDGQVREAMLGPWSTYWALESAGAA